MSNKSDTYVFLKGNGYISKGSTVDVPRNWTPGGLMVSAVVNMVGSDMKIYLTKALTEALIKQEVIAPQPNKDNGDKR
jgi:hypothetical protein